jgi:hypothetical protein
MIDLLMLILIAVAFAGAMTYVRACDGLTGRDGSPIGEAP